MSGVSNKLKFLPIVTVCWLFITFTISYTIAVCMDHVYPVWPYISDTGTLPPESCYFGQMLNIGAMLVGVIFYFRYKQVQLQLSITRKHIKLLKILNITCLVSGILTAFGLSMVANFQETSDLYMHIFGATLAFNVGIGYFIMQTILCGLMNAGDPYGYKINILRTCFCVLLIISFLSTVTFCKISMKDIKGGTREAMQYNPSYPKYFYRLASTFSEWLMGLCYALYLITFNYEFGKLDCQLTFCDRRVKNMDTEIQTQSS